MLYFPISNSLGVPFVIVYIGVACVQAEHPHANPNFQKDLKDFDEKKHDSLISFFFRFKSKLAFLRYNIQFVAGWFGRYGLFTLEKSYCPWALLLANLIFYLNVG